MHGLDLVSVIFVVFALATIFVAIKRHTTINLLNRVKGIKRKAVRERSSDGILSHLIF